MPELANLVTYNPFAFTKNLPLSQVWTTMLQMGLDALPVRDEAGNVAGIAGHRQLCRRANDLGIAETVTLDACLTTTPSCESNATPGEVLDLLLAHDLPILPIVENERLVAVVSRSDFLRDLSFHELPSSGVPVVEVLHKIEDWHETDLDCDEAIAEQERNLDGVLSVGKGDMLIGVVSAKALTRAWSCWHFKRLMPHDPPVNEPTSLAMLSRMAPAASPGSSLADIASIMLDENVDAVTVGNATRRVLGYVTALDLLKAIRNDV
jgi:CBS domain-containing protein